MAHRNRRGRWFFLPALGAVVAGCAGGMDSVFTGVGLAALLLILTLGGLNYLTRGRAGKKAQLIRAVVVALLLLTMIALLIIIVMRSGIGRI